MPDQDSIDPLRGRIDWPGFHDTGGAGRPVPGLADLRRDSPLASPSVTVLPRGRLWLEWYMAAAEVAVEACEADVLDVDMARWLRRFTLLGS